ncbi:ABC-type amino acid transport substrate-binding protein [Thiothrix caldifontis]|uniref:ABC-type amino acid transport substrate-binding protein n=1 Tax=Thiothrix caldifontis TaxID=525918 RepID=A0A1H4FHU4_9GAMM|nr:ABC transporter substrate-binding protein [Thiothrix caldifontis]SEA96919.1 ABC-type amino acid transport substrate-binding protein [Thiothrix caldifontis]
MRKLIWSCGVALFCLATNLAAAVPPPSPPTASAAATQPAEPVNVLAAAKQAGVLRVAMEPDFPPMYWLNEEGKEDGFDYHLALLVAKELGIPAVKAVEDDYSKLPGLAVEGKADMVMGGYIPDDSIEGVDWTDSYLDFGQCLIVPRGSTIKNIKQLRGKTIGAYEDPAVIKWINDNIPDKKALVTYEGVGWFRHLEKRDVDAIIYDYPFTVEEIKPFSSSLQIAAFNLNESTYAIGIKQGNDEMRTAVNTALAKIKESSEYAELIKRYLPFKISKEVPDGSNTYTIQPGDSLGKIAAAKLGTTTAWKTLWELNKNRIPNPNLLETGDVLIMPDTKAKETP